jgi:hypothetical protein
MKQQRHPPEEVIRLLREQDRSGLRKVWVVVDDGLQRGDFMVEPFRARTVQEEVLVEKCARQGGMPRGLTEEKEQRMDADFGSRSALCDEAVVPAGVRTLVEHRFVPEESPRVEDDQ